MPLKHLLKANIDGWRYIINPKYDKDLVVVVEGEERIGKSALAFEIANYFDPNFNIHRIAWDVPGYKKLVYSVPPCSAVIADEGVSMFFSRNAMSRENKEAMDLFTICGHQNLLHIICATRLSGLDSYLKDGRVGAIIKVTARGRFKFYSKNKVKLIKKLPNGKYVYPSCSFAERFTHPPEDRELWTAYKKAKSEYNKERLAPPEDDDLVGTTEGARYAGRAVGTMYNWIKEGKLKEQTVKGKRKVSKKEIDKLLKALL